MEKGPKRPRSVKIGKPAPLPFTTNKRLRYRNIITGAPTTRKATYEAGRRAADRLIKAFPPDDK